MTTIIHNDRGAKLERLGTIVLRYGLVIVLLWVGMLKFTAYEAIGVHGLASNSPLLSWLSSSMSERGFSILLGVIEITLGILIATRPFSPKASAIGSMGAIIMSLITYDLFVINPRCMATRIWFSLSFAQSRSVSGKRSSAVGCSNIYRRRSIKGFYKYEERK